MASITIDDEEVNEAVAQLYSVRGDPDADRADLKAACRELLEAASQQDAGTREEAVEIVTEVTDYSKGTVRDWLDEITAEVTQEAIEVTEVLKHIPADPDDPYLYEFQVLVDGVEYSFTVSSEHITTDRVFQRKLLERTDTLIEFEDWTSTVNGWLEQAKIKETPAEPTSAAHAVAEAVLHSIQTLECRPDPAKMRELDTSFAYYDDDPDIDGRDEPVLWVSGSLIDRAAKQTIGEIDHTHTRAILDPYLAHEHNSVRTFDGGFRAWAFDYNALHDEGMVESEETILGRADDEADTEANDEADTEANDEADSQPDTEEDTDDDE